MANLTSTPLEMLPAFLPPPGVLPDFDDPPNNNPLGLGTIITSVILSTILMSLRIYSRAALMKRFALEDYLGLVSFGLFAACIGTIVVFYRTTGIWVHQWDVRLGQFLKATYHLNILKVLYSALMLFTKAAILLEWERIFVARGTKDSFYWIMRAVLVLHVSFYVSVIFILSFACKPAAASFDVSIQGECIDRRALDIGTSTFNLIFDLCMLALPQGRIWTLHMSTRRKIQISVVFSIGILACAGAAGRLWSTIDIDYAGEITYKISNMVMFALMEVTCALIVFCVPALPKIFQNTNFLTNLGASLRSWSLLSRSSKNRDVPSSDLTADSWPRSSVLAETRGNYERISSQKAIPLSQLETGLAARVQVSPQHTVTTQHNGQNQIWRLTEFSREEAAATSSPSMAQTHTKEPWQGPRQE